MPHSIEAAIESEISPGLFSSFSIRVHISRISFSCHFRFLKIGIWKKLNVSIVADMYATAAMLAFRSSNDTYQYIAHKIRLSLNWTAGYFVKHVPFWFHSILHYKRSTECVSTCNVCVFRSHGVMVRSNSKSSKQPQQCCSMRNEERFGSPTNQKCIRNICLVRLKLVHSLSFSNTLPFLCSPCVFEMWFCFFWIFLIWLSVCVYECIMQGMFNVHVQWYLTHSMSSSTTVNCILANCSLWFG